MHWMRCQMPSVDEAAISLASWTESLPAEVGASIYALEPARRLAGGLAAHAAGMWVHADIILQPGSGRGFVNTGVSVSEVLGLLEAVPDARVDVHLMVLAPGPGWERAVDDVAARLARTSVLRWSARPAVLGRLHHLLSEGAQRWVEVRSAAECDAAPGSDGFLVMLIEPGSKGTADPGATDHVAVIAAGGAQVGVDGGVTPEVAEAAVAAGASHLVVGRALWAH